MKYVLAGAVAMFALGVSSAWGADGAATGTPSATGAAAPDVGRWRYADTVSALDGSHKLLANLSAEGQVFNSIGVMEAPVLQFDCDTKGLQAGIIWPDLIGDIGDDGHARMAYKIDDGSIQHPDWYHGTSSIGPIGAAAQAWIKQLATAKRLVVQIPDRHGDQEAVFDLSGVAAIAAPFEQATCGESSSAAFSGRATIGATTVVFGADLGTMKPHSGLPGGALVDFITAGSVAAKAGVHWADIIVAWNGETISNEQDLRKALSQTRQGDTVVFQVLRGRKTVDLRASF